MIPRVEVKHKMTNKKYNYVYIEMKFTNFRMTILGLLQEKR